MSESAYTVGDPLPEIRGLLHVKNDIEKKMLSSDTDRQRVIIALWSKNNKDIESFLDGLNMLAYQLQKHQEHKVRVIAVNTDRIFLYNEEMQKILVDKVNLIFLRDSEFANLNNLFGCKFIRNEWSAGP